MPDVREKVRKSNRETALQAPMSVKEGEEVLQVPEQRCPCSPWKDHGEVGCPATTHGKDHVGADGYALKQAAACGEPTQYQAVGRNYDLWRGAHTGTVCPDSTPCEQSCWSS